MKRIIQGVLLFTYCLAALAENTVSGLQGSGVIISRSGHIVTNRHVVKNGCSKLVIEDYLGKRVTANILSISNNADIALLGSSLVVDPIRDVHAVIRVNPERTSLILPQLNESTHFAGYPDGQFEPRGGLVNGLQDPKHGDIGFTIGLNTSYGASGGPIFDDDGLLIGILWGGNDDKTHLAVYGLNLTALLPLLRSEKVKPSVASPSDSPNRHQTGEDRFSTIKRVIGVGMQATVKIYCFP